MSKPINPIMGFAKDELFEAYNINDTHDVWNDVDVTCAKKLFTIMNGREPDSDDTYIESALVFLNNVNANHTNEWMMRSDYGNLYITAKRIIYNVFKPTKS